MDLELAGPVGLVPGLAGRSRCIRRWCRPSGAGGRGRRSPRSRNSPAHGGGSRPARRACRRMIQTRTLSVSDSSSRADAAVGLAAFALEFGLDLGRPLAAVRVWPAFLSSMVRAMAFLQGLLAQYSGIFRTARMASATANERQATAAPRDRRLDERPVRGAAAARARLGRRHLRAGRERAVPAAAPASSRSRTVPRRCAGSASIRPISASR